MRRTYHRDVTNARLDRTLAGAALLASGEKLTQGEMP